MHLPARPLALVTVLGISLLSTACGSNIKDKIEGKWKLLSSSEVTPEASRVMKRLEERQAYFYFEFKRDGTFVGGFESDKAETVEWIKTALKTALNTDNVTWTAKYRLWGDKVEFYDLGPGTHLIGTNARSKVTINGDEMTIEIPTGQVYKLVRMRDSARPTNTN